MVELYLHFTATDVEGKREGIVFTTQFSANVVAAIATAVFLL